MQATQLFLNTFKYLKPDNNNNNDDDDNNKNSNIKLTSRSPWQRLRIAIEVRRWRRASCCSSLVNFYGVRTESQCLKDTFCSATTAVIYWWQSTRITPLRETVPVFSEERAKRTSSASFFVVILEELRGCCFSTRCISSGVAAARSSSVAILCRCGGGSAL